MCRDLHSVTLRNHSVSWGWNMGPDFPNLGSQSLKTPTIPGSTCVFRESAGVTGVAGGMGSLPPGWGRGPQGWELTRRPE